MPDRCDIGIDRRLLPGESPELAVADIAAIAKTVDGAPIGKAASRGAWKSCRGAMMYPSLVAEDSAVVCALAQAARAALGAAPAMHYATNAFDQGFLNHIGIEACTYGPGEATFAHTDLDMASVQPHDGRRQGLRDADPAAARVIWWRWRTACRAVVWPLCRVPVREERIRCVDRVPRRRRCRYVAWAVPHHLVDDRQSAGLRNPDPPAPARVRRKRYR